MPIVQADRLTHIGAALLRAAGASQEEADAVAVVHDHPKLDRVAGVVREVPAEPVPGPRVRDGCSHPGAAPAYREGQPAHRPDQQARQQHSCAELVDETACEKAADAARL